MPSSVSGNGYISLFLFELVCKCVEEAIKVSRAVMASNCTYFPFFFLSLCQLSKRKHVGVNQNLWLTTAVCAKLFVTPFPINGVRTVTMTTLLLIFQMTTHDVIYQPPPTLPCP